MFGYQAVLNAFNIYRMQTKLPVTNCVDSTPGTVWNDVTCVNNEEKTDGQTGRQTDRAHAREREREREREWEKERERERDRYIYIYIYTKMNIYIYIHMYIYLKICTYLWNYTRLCLNRNSAVVRTSDLRRSAPEAEATRPNFRIPPRRPDHWSEQGAKGSHQAARSARIRSSRRIMVYGRTSHSDAHSGLRWCLAGETADALVLTKQSHHHLGRKNNCQLEAPPQQKIKTMTLGVYTRRNEATRMNHVSPSAPRQW